MAALYILTRCTTSLVVPSTGLCSRPPLRSVGVSTPRLRLQMVAEDDDWEEIDGEDTVESWDAQMAAMKEWETTKDVADPVAPASSKNDPDDVASALADVGAAMIELGRTVEALAATLNVANPPPSSTASPTPPPVASQEQDRVLLSPDELLATVPAAVASLLDGRMVRSTAATAPAPAPTPATPPPSSPPKAAAAGFMGTAAESDEDASWFRQDGEAEAPSELRFDDDGDCLVDMPDWRETRARQLGKPAPPPPKAVAPRLSEGVAAAAAAAAAKMTKELAAKAAAKAAASPARVEEAEWDGSADEGAYFDYDVDDDLPDWRESRK